jgi:cold shock CspA family protein
MNLQKSDDIEQSDSSFKPIMKWGFGMSPISNTMKERYDDAVQTLTLFLRDIITTNEIELNVVSELKGMFNRSLRKDQWDWFTVYERLGYPSRREMQYFVYKIIALRQSLRDRETTLIDATKNDLVRSTLLDYLDYWRNAVISEEDAQQGWLYILSTKNQPDILKIGMTIRTVPERVKEINSATGVLYPFSARTAYKVKDARDAERRVFQLLSDYRIRRDREFFEIPFCKAAQIIEEALFSEQALKRKQGKVKWFNEFRGYGFIQYKDEIEIFVHINEILDKDIKSLKQNQRVEFDIQHSSKGISATRVTVMDE